MNKKKLWLFKNQFYLVLGILCVWDTGMWSWQYWVRVTMACVGIYFYTKAQKQENEDE